VASPEQRSRRKTSGDCVNCACRPAKKGCADCVHCLREKNRTQIALKEERRELGLCPHCGGRRPDKRYVGCKKCRAVYADRTRRWKLRQKET
jgi:hypothetical protein